LTKGLSAAVSARMPPHQPVPIMPTLILSMTALPLKPMT
jgi:hypothetical protein